jgi:uncharacterized protein (TIGR00369 family)
VSAGPPDGSRAVDGRPHPVGDYFRLERWEIPPPEGEERPSTFGARAPVDAHLRGPGGGLRTGGLLTAVDSLGGQLSGMAVLPQWIVTTSIMATVSRLAHVGPMRLEGALLRRGRNSVVTGIDILDEGAHDRRVAAATMTCAVLDPGDMDLSFVRPVVAPMPPLVAGAPGPEEFFGIEPGSGMVTRLRLADRLRNPWGILHGGAIAMLADEAACRATRAGSPQAVAPGGAFAATDAVLHYLRPARVGPVEARCRVLGSRAGRTAVRVDIHDVGADDRAVVVGSVTVRGI